MVEVFPTQDALLRAAAERFVAAAQRGATQSGRSAVALSGGSTPAGLYRALAAEPFASRVDWSRVHFFWSDERCVPPEHPASNYRLAKEALLDRIPVPAGNIHRIRGETDPEQAARLYEAELRAEFGTPEGPPRTGPGTCFDLVLLGLGADGHTASLFPGHTTWREASRWAVADRSPEGTMWRVTLTPIVINAAVEVVFLVAGEEKAGVLQRVLRGNDSPDQVPARAIAPSPGVLRWLVDAPAAAGL